jgi:low affinity Fe/Cu permease
MGFHPVLVIVFWGLSGPYFHSPISGSWSYIPLPRLSPSSQNRDARAIHLKLDAIIHAIKGARNEMIQIENLSDADLEMISKSFEKIRAECERISVAK